MLRVEREDYQQAVALQEELHGVFKLSISDVLREAIHVGLPRISDNYREMLKTLEKKKKAS